jgi:hypothetical protein
MYPARAAILEEDISLGLPSNVVKSRPINCIDDPDSAETTFVLLRRPDRGPYDTQLPRRFAEICGNIGPPPDFLSCRNNERKYS